MPDRDLFLDWFRNAAPYFNAHRSRCIVIHVDGEVSAGEDFTEFVHDLALLHSLGVRLVLVPGIRPQIEQRLARDGRASQLVSGLRVTDAPMMPAVRDAAADVCTELQARLSMGLANSPMHGARIRVMSGNFITARPMGVLEGVDYGHTGSVRRVDKAGIDAALEAQAVVLVAPLGYSPTGETFNLHAESVATAVAVELRAHKLLFIARGAALRDEQGERIENLGLADALRLQGEMRSRTDTDAHELSRFEAAVHACRNGVRRVHLLDAERRGALALELYSRDGVGTMINADAYDDVRRATIEDVGGILELIEPLEREGLLVRRERADIERTIGHYFIEERDGAIVACTAAHPFLDESVAELACLAVRSDYRHTGRGDMLLAAVEAEARRLGAGRLFVLTTQTTHWFRERGFQERDLESLPVERRELYNYQRQSKVLVKSI
jgi:amino-acid N-acetyltransferase